ncbi:MAG: biopolymer transporter ExbD [Pseudomonadota bacterium]
MLPSNTRRRRLSMTSLIDVIFLLLLFFMLTSTFSRFGEIKLSLGSTAAESQGASDVQLVLLRLSTAGLSINGVAVPVDQAAAGVEAMSASNPAHLVISLTDGATSQDLVSVMHELRGLENTQMTIVQ